jgi:glycosyltransferase involved in cell wall biosynthesis
MRSTQAEPDEIDGATAHASTSATAAGGPSLNSIAAPSPRLGRGVVLYDYLHCLGGAEQVSLRLLDAFPDASLCVGYRDLAAFPDAVVPPVRLHDLKLPARFPGGRTLFGMFGFRTRTRFLKGYDWAIFSGALTPEGVYQRPQGCNLYYCHTLPRFAYDLYPFYRARLPWAAQPLLALATAVTRARYPPALARMDLIIANSGNVRARLKNFLGLSAQVIHPPCDTAGFRWLDAGDTWLSTARLEPYKRVGVLVEAFRRMPEHRLVIASGGSEEPMLRQLAAGAANIRFAGWLDADALREAVGRCRATLYIPQDEDFGMSPVESMAAGKPVIGVAEGGLLETVVHDQTGLLINTPPTPERVMAAVTALTPERALAMRGACEARAKLFTIERFTTSIQAAVQGVLSNGCRN